MLQYLSAAKQIAIAYAITITLIITLAYGFVGATENQEICDRDNCISINDIAAPENMNMCLNEHCEIISENE